MIYYEFLFENKLLLVRITGDIDKKTMLSFLNFLFHIKETSGVSKAIMDFRKTVFQFSLKDLEEIVKLRIESSDLVKEIQVVHLVKTSFETAYTMLYAQQIPQEVDNIEVCSTLKRTIQFLALDLSEEALEGALEHLAISYH